MTEEQLAALKAEFETDPVPMGYDYANTDAQTLFNLITALTRSKNLSSITGDQVFQATVPAEYAALSDAKKSEWMSFCGRQSIDPFGSANVSFVQYIFGGGSTTVANLANVRVQSISRAEEIGLGNVQLRHVNWLKTGTRGV